MKPNDRVQIQILELGMAGVGQSIELLTVPDDRQPQAAAERLD